nr:UDP-N-acetylmuramoyl-L-alanyl-D-glutamate--2,6-diaminopimelate ligase [Dermatophilus congolensis]
MHVVITVNRPEHVSGTSIAQIVDLIRGTGVDVKLRGAITETDKLLTGATLDSREVQPGDLYAALPGANVHGAQFAQKAVESGAQAILTDPHGAELSTNCNSTLIVVPDPRAVLGAVSAAIYNNPTAQLGMVGITGTNGKTTTAYLVESAWRALGRTTGLIGTIETRIAGSVLRSSHTTPESPKLQGVLALMREHEVSHCVMEVSSHALSLHRADAIRFDTAVFTNLSQDHLDFHESMEDYFQAKATLFTPEHATTGVICIDDTWGRRLAQQSTIPTITLATPSFSDSTCATTDQTSPTAEDTPTPDWRLVTTGDKADTAFELVREGTHTGPGRLRLNSALPGEHNRINTALAALVLLASGLPVNEIERAMGARPRVPGRMEIVPLHTSTLGSADNALTPEAYVDFAHTPDAITATLTALRARADQRGGNLVAVIGAGGDRDAGKRPLMGAAAAALADVVVVTDDNPRCEDPAIIRAAVTAGAHSASQTTVLEQAGRAEGIAAAIRHLEPQGILAVLGKGHESTQTIGTETIPFDDREAIAAAWASHLGSDQEDR